METNKKIKSFNVVFIWISTLLAVVFIYKTTLIWLYERYVAVDSYYSHGFLIPFVTLFLIWHKRKELATANWIYSKWGLALIIFALFVHIASLLTGVFFISGFTLLLLVFGIVLFLFGKEFIKKILFPLSFLIFMFPLPLVAVNAISFPMKMFVTKSVVLILRVFLKIPIRNEGFQIFFPNGTLTVENPCSGLRSLIVILALGSIFSYFLKANIEKKVLFFLLAAPVAVFSNMIRVVLLSLAVYIYGSKVADGFFHDFTGYLVFIISFIALYSFWRRFQCKSS